MDYESLKVVDLKQKLAERGLSQAGLKADLVKRLQESDAGDAPASEDDSRSASSKKRKATDELTEDASKPKKLATDAAPAQSAVPNTAFPRFGVPQVTAVAPPAVFSNLGNFSPFGFGAAVADQPKPNGDDELVQKLANRDNTTAMVSSKALTKVSVEPLAEALKQPDCKISEIRFRAVQMDRESWVLLSDALKINTSVRALHLSECNAAASELDIIVDALAVNKTITSVDLGNIPALNGKTFARLLGLESSSIASLFVKASRLTDSVLQHPDFVSSLGNNTVLTWLDLSDNLIGPVGIRCLAEALKINKSLKRLDLTCLDFGIQGSQDLGEALKQNNTLTELLMYGCKGTTAGVVALMDALMSNTSVQRISIPAWFSGDVAGKRICELLKSNKSIIYMDLRRNNFTDAIAPDFAEALKVAQQVESIDFENNSFTEVGARLFAEALQVNMKSRVNMYGCPITPQTKNKISSSVDGHRLTLK